jgi:hypothetical protein
LIPITIMIDGKYYDASAYKAAPVPMALWSETVYEAVRTGVSMGLFTVTAALQRKGANESTEWIAEGTWQDASSIKAKVAKKPVASIPRGMNEDEGPPVLRRAGSNKPKPPEAPATPTTPPPAATGSPAPAATVPSTPAPTASPSPSPAAPSHSEQVQQDKPPEDQTPEDKDRPALKRGKAGAASAEEAQKKAMAAASAKTSGHASPSTSSATTAGTLSASQSAASNQIQLIPAISDSDGPDSLPYTYNLKPEEEQQFRKKMLAMAADEVRARAAQLMPASPSTAQPAHAAQHGKATAAKPAQPTFEDVQLRVFDLADINEPELILTANARMPQRSGEKDSATSDIEYTVTLVVREDVNGDLHKALANVTDTQHTDVIPRLDLIDAVDVDGDGRGELLFRQVSDAGSAFVIYRVIGDRLYPLFQGAPTQ